MPPIRSAGYAGLATGKLISVLSRKYFCTRKCRVETLPNNKEGDDGATTPGLFFIGKVSQILARLLHRFVLKRLSITCRAAVCHRFGSACEPSALRTCGVAGQLGPFEIQVNLVLDMPKMPVSAANLATFQLKLPFHHLLWGRGHHLTGKMQLNRVTHGTSVQPASRPVGRVHVARNSKTITCVHSTPPALAHGAHSNCGRAPSQRSQRNAHVAVSASNNGAAVSEDNVYDAVVVGAGISGLVTALSLHTNHSDNVRQFLVTEARERVGGNITSKSSDDGYVWEEGPNSFQPNDSMLQIAVSGAGMIVSCCSSA